MEKYLFLKPIYKEMIWGSESWAISAHPHGDCEIIGGMYHGEKLSTIWKEHRELFGNITGKEFPLLAKFIDAKDRLSVQVHPDDMYARASEDSLGKNECWYIVDAKDDASIIIGHNALSKKELISKIFENQFDNLLTSQQVKKDDFFYIEAGTIHAIGAGCYIYEIQQSSDITYRVYDYHRKDKNGNQRELHIDRSLDVITIPYKPYPITKEVTQYMNYEKTKLLETSHFTVNQYDIHGTCEIENDKPFLLVTVIDGFGTIDLHHIETSTSFIITSNTKKFRLQGKMKLLIASL